VAREHNPDNPDMWASLQAVVDETVKRGADEAECYLVRTWLHQVRIFNRKIEMVRNAMVEGIGLRANAQFRQGYVYISPAAFPATGLAETVVAVAGQATPDPHNRLPTDSTVRCCLPVANRRARSIDLRDKVRFAQQAEAAALGFSPLVVGTEDVEYVDYDQETVLLNSHGLRRYQDLSFSSLGVTAVADEGGSLQSGLSYGYSAVPGQFCPERVGIEAAKRAIRVRGARSRESAEVPVIFDALAASGLIRIIAESFSADAVARGRSRLKDRLGDMVAAPQLSIVDHGSMAGAPAYSAFDGEGVPTDRSAVVCNGRLVTFLRTTYAANRDYARATGNARRRSFRTAPEFGLTNFYIEPGQSPPERLREGIREGLFVQELQGLHLANRVSGDFSVGVTGCWIRDGELAEPVRGTTVADNMFDVLLSVDGIGDDIRFVPQLAPNRASFGSPTVRVRSMVVSGKR